MTYNVLSGTLNPTQSINQYSLWGDVAINAEASSGPSAHPLKELKSL